MTDYRERLACEIRTTLGDLNDDDLPVVTLVERLRAENTAIKQQAQQWKMEAETQASIVRKCYQICTGSTGEPGDWNGAEPVRKLAAERDALRADAERYRWLRDKDTGPCQIWETVCEQDGMPPYYSLKHSDELDAAIDAAKEQK